MAKKTFLVDLDLAKNELQNASIQNLSGAPTTDPEVTDKGLIFYDTTMKKMRIWDGTKWNVVGADVGSQYVENLDLAATVGNLPEFDSLNGTEIVDSGVSASAVSTHMANTTSNSKHLKDNESDAMAASTADTPNKPSSSNKFATINDLSTLGSGDMLKATYDTNSNGKVDTSDAFIAHAASTNPHAITPEMIDALPLAGGTMDDGALIDFAVGVNVATVSENGFWWGDPTGTVGIGRFGIEAGSTTPLTWDDKGSVGVNTDTETGFALNIDGKTKGSGNMELHADSAVAPQGYYTLNTVSGSPVVTSVIRSAIYGGDITLTKTGTSGTDTGITFRAYQGSVGINTDTIVGYSLNVKGKGKFTGTVDGIVPTADNHLATKKYVDDGIGNVPADYLPLAGGLMDVDSYIQFNSGVYPTRYTASGIEWDNPGGITTIGNYGIVTKGFDILLWDSSGKTGISGPVDAAYDINLSGDVQVTADLDVGGTVDATVFSGPININRNTITAIHSNGGGELVLESEGDIVLNAPTVAEETLVVMGDSTLNGFTEMNKDLSVLAKIYSMPTVAGDSDGVVTTKGYVDGLVAGGVQFRGGYNASTNKVVGGINDGDSLIGSHTNAVVHGDMYETTVAGTPPGCTLALEVGDVVIANTDVAAGTTLLCSHWTMVQKNLDIATETTYGILQVATDAEVMNGITSPASDEAAVTPEKLKLWRTEFKMAGSIKVAVGSGGLTATVSTYPVDVEQGYTIQVTDDFGVEYQFEHTPTDPTSLKVTSNSNIPTGLTARVVGSLVLNP